MPLRFEKRLIAAERFESAAFIDVNNDGVTDIVSGEWWYEGPDFRRRHRIGTVRTEGEYYDDFSTVPMDVNGDGYPDFVTGGWWGNTLRWRENPGAVDAEWPEHVIAECGNIETTRAWDVDRDGTLELVPNTPNGPLVVYKLVSPATGAQPPQFETHTIFPRKQGHGLGFGDVSGSGRGDFVLSHGWLEAPPDALSEPWIWHPEFNLRSASVPVIVTDLTGNGVGDLIVGQSHAYGLSWWEQSIVDGEREWSEHIIDGDNSQYHDMHWIDIDGDGACELVTGKRFRAHCGRDPGSTDPVGIYYFKWTGEGFSKQVVNYGRPLEATGCGIHFDLADVTGNGLPDILAPGKDGLYVFYNLGCDAW
jgi:hypothetical protein